VGAPIGEGWQRDPDVLDTWFSSALWPFSTLGWPKETDDFKRYYPNNVLVTGYDIIPFWVNRMTFQGLEFTGKRPFKDCIIHGLIRDKQGRKMSKSLGNGIDPMDVIETYGTDSLRYFLTTNSAPGMDLRYDEEKVKSAWNFINKLWNASRFVLMKLENFSGVKIDEEQLTIADKWILQKQDNLISEVTRNMDRYDFHTVGNALYQFVWEDFCDNYIEFTKGDITDITKAVLLDTLTVILKLLHPFMPYVTEEIYQVLPFRNDDSIMVSTYPQKKNIQYEKEMNIIDKVIGDITEIRNLKVVNHIGKDAYVLFKAEEGLQDIYISQLKITNLVEETLSDYQVISYESSYVKISYFIKTEIDQKSLLQEKERLLNSIHRRKNLLSNDNYINKAPANIVEADRMKLKEEEEKLISINHQLEQ